MHRTIVKADLSRKPLLHIFLIMVLCLIVYSNTLNAPFQLDDIPVIVENSIVKNLGFMVKPSEAKVYKGHFEYDTFRRRYVGYLAFALNYWTHKLDVTGYHLVNLAIHIINALIVYWLVILTFRTPFLNSSTLRARSNQIALFASLLFACHPIQTQAVIYIWQRITLLVTTFYLLSLVMYIKWRLTPNKTGSLFPKMSLLFYLGSIISAVLAMKTKENAFTLPVVILVYEFMFFGGELRKRLLYLAPLLLTMLIIPASLLEVNKPIGDLIGDVSEATRSHPNMSRWNYLLTQFSVIATYVRLIFLPLNQNLDYDYPIYNNFLTPKVFISFLLLFSIFGLGFYLFLKSKTRNSTYSLIAFGVFWFFITLSVESSFIPLRNVIFEHRVYLPSIGFFIALLSGVFLLLNKLGERRLHTIGATIFIAVIIVLSFATYSRNKVWGSEIALWRDCVEKSPQKARPHNNLGLALYEQGSIEEAIGHYLKALQIDPQYAKAHNNMGVALLELGRIEDALKHCLKALHIKPDYEKAYYNTGVAIAKQGRTEDAIDYYLKALKIKPDYAKAHNNLGNALLKLGRIEEAIEHYLKALQIQPNLEESLNNLGVSLFRKGDVNGAIARFREALQIKPDYVHAKNNLNKLLMIKQQKQ